MSEARLEMLTFLSSLEASGFSAAFPRESARAERILRKESSLNVRMLLSLKVLTLMRLDRGGIGL